MSAKPFFTTALAEPVGPMMMDGPVLVTLADVEAEDVEYLWRPRIPRGKLTIIAGDPGGGKTYVTSGDMAASRAGSAGRMAGARRSEAC